LAFSYWFDKPQFLTEGRLATVLIIPSSWVSQLGGHLPASDFHLIESMYRAQTNATHAKQEHECSSPSLTQISPEATNAMER
jgi:hypothetical protein